MKDKISRKVAIKQIGLLSLSPIVSVSLPENTGMKRWLGGGSAADPANPFDKRIVLQPFAYNDVELRNSSLNRQVESIIDYYLRIPNDDLLKGFRERVGKATYWARNLGGWYSKDKYHIFGQILSGLSRLYAASGNETCKEKVSSLIGGWAECIEPDGYFFYTEKLNSPHYVFDKMVGGLVDAHIFTKNKDAPGYLSIITDWAIRNLDRRTPYAFFDTKEKKYINEEWYTLSENLFRAYEATGDKKYFDFAQHWEYSEYWEILARGESIFQRDVYYHAYSHLNTMSGAAMAYKLKGGDHYLNALKNAFDFFRDEECFATGGYGPEESLLPKNKIIESLLSKSIRTNTFETQCGTWAAFKLCKYLLMFTGDARYGDWIEKLIYNGAGASIPLSPDGKVFYYSDYNPREGTKGNYVEGWSCCNGTRPQLVAEYSNLIYFKNNDGIFINLYTPSVVEWNNLRLTQKTRFPEDNAIVFKINTRDGKGTGARLRFRKPGWLPDDFELFVNGQKMNSSDFGITANWIVLSGLWKNGDEIKLILPMNLSISRLDQKKEYPAAITYGPVVMAARSVKKYPSGLLKNRSSFQDFIPVPGEPVNWHVKGHDDLLIKPFYSYKEGEGYIMYIDPSVSNWIPLTDLNMTGQWKRWWQDYYYSNEKGNSIKAGFEGEGIRIYLTGYSNSGKCEVWIDGKLTDTIDEYSPDARKDFYKDYKGLANGTHTIELKVLDEKNKQSKDTYVNVRMFERLVSP